MKATLLITVLFAGFAFGMNAFADVLTLKDGRTITGRADFGKGSPTNPMSYDEVAEKFQGCAAFAEWPAAKSTQVIDLVRKLEDVPDVRVLTALLSK